MAMSIPSRVKTYKNISLKSLDNTIPSMVEWFNGGTPVMNNPTQVPLLSSLKDKGWTNASIADAIGVTVNAVEKWQSGQRNITASHLILLNQLTDKTPPKKRRYAPGSRVREGVR
jgi:hypothetical protein